MAVRRSNLDLNVLSLSVTKLVELLCKGPYGLDATNGKDGDASWLGVLLGVPDLRPSRRGAKQVNELPPLHLPLV
jgi:hypothetical protein